MALLDIICFTTIGLTFYLAFTVFRDEKEAIYLVVLEFLANVYRSISLMI